MSDVKNVLTLLCETMNMCCDSSLKVEHFFVSQDDSLVREAINSLTSSVERLAESVVETKLGKSLSVAHIQESSLRIKLLMAYLRYPLPDFYINLKTKTVHSLNNLILVFGWLIVEQRALKFLICNYLQKNEFYDRKLIEITRMLENNEQSSASIDGILKDSGKLDFDMRQIYNLLSTKAKLITKLSSASRGILNLDHLSLEELALLKRVSENKKEAEPTKEYLKDLHRQATLIEKYTKVRRNITVFIKWIVSFKNRMEQSQADDSKEIFEFLHLLHQVVKSNLCSKNFDLSRSNLNDGCSQLRKIDNGEVETEIWLENLVNLSDKLKCGLKHYLVSLNEYFKCDINDT